MPHFRHYACRHYIDAICRYADFQLIYAADRYFRFHYAARRHAAAAAAAVHATPMPFIFAFRP
jgi:hypothetical protein